MWPRATHVHEGQDRLSFMKCRAWRRKTHQFTDCLHVQEDRCARAKLLALDTLLRSHAAHATLGASAAWVQGVAGLQFGGCLVHHSVNSIGGNATGIVVHRHLEVACGRQGREAAGLQVSCLLQARAQRDLQWREVCRLPALCACWLQLPMCSPPVHLRRPSDHSRSS